MTPCKDAGAPGAQKRSSIVQSWIHRQMSDIVESNSLSAGPRPDEAARWRTCALCDSRTIVPYRRLTRRYAGTEYPLDLGQCATCGFVFLQNDQRIRYDSDYLHQEHVLARGHPLARFRAEERIAGIARVVSPGRDRRFLDIGVGDGLMLSVAEAAGYVAFGLDVNPDAADVARREYGVRAEIRTDPLAVAYAGQTFQVIHMNEVVEHIPEPMALLRWCRERLAPGGCVVIQTGNIDSLASRIKGASWDYFRPVHVSYFSTATLSSALGRAGFSIIHYASVDWRVLPSLQMTWTLLSRGRVGDGLRFLLLYSTALLPGLRRTVTIYARPAPVA